MLLHIKLKPSLSSSQQKLVLRNNSTTVTQQLRLLIRGQDQDCFQVCVSFISKVTQGRKDIFYRGCTDPCESKHFREKF